mmetsp:Transcript_26158/g.61455  ORF Transcript_26158/g.61455 Transcript_26158/m.61455 type:complete len:102 (+) Transcript_26158:284-589(+)
MLKLEKLEDKRSKEQDLLLYRLQGILQDHSQAHLLIGNFFFAVFACELSFCLDFIAAQQNHFSSSQPKINRELKPSIQQPSSNRSSHTGQLLLKSIQQGTP